jgi:FAD/FMN-containing dehydrogenase/Fe-S oxidoreductase
VPEYRSRREALAAERAAAAAAAPGVPADAPDALDPAAPAVETPPAASGDVRVPEVEKAAVERPAADRRVVDQSLTPVPVTVEPHVPPVEAKAKVRASLKLSRPAAAPTRTKTVPVPELPPTPTAKDVDLRELGPLAAALVESLAEAGVEGVEAGRRRRAEYSSDASLYRVVPQAVVFPRHADELSAILTVCTNLAVPLTVRGAGTSIAGNAVGAGVVADLSRYLNAVTAVDPQSRTATVQPGVVLSKLQAAAAPYGLRFGPDPSTHNRATIGGMIGNNACGSRALAYGRTADNLLGLEVLTGAGEKLSLVSPAWLGLDPNVPKGTPLRSSAPLQALQHLVQANLATIRTEFGRFGRQVSGYSFEHLLPEKQFDLARFMAGTEGTLAVVTSATLRLVDVPTHSVLVALGYRDMAAAGDAVPAVLPYKPVAVEGLDARIVEAVRTRRGADAVPALPEGAGWLFVELAGPDPADLVARGGAMARTAGALDARVLTDAAEMARLWRIREAGAGLSGRSPNGKPAHAGWEDSAVPVESLGAYLRDFEALLQRFDLSCMPYGHFGDGCLHARIDLPLSATDGTRVFREFLTAAAETVARYGGSLSGEHGDGRARSELLPTMYSPAALELFTQAKAAFDPEGVLNPGIVVRPAAMDVDLRIPAAARAAPLRRRPGLAYHEDSGDFAQAVHRCTGIGACRADTTATGGAMCPSYVATGDEKDTTRARARVLQEMVNGTLVRSGWRSQEVHDALDACLGCKACSSECPTGIDMASYKTEVLYQSYRHRIRPRSHYTLGRLPRWARLASRASGMANRAMSSPALGSVVKRLSGVDQRRSLPTFAGQTVRAWFSARAAQAAREAKTAAQALAAAEKAGVATGTALPPAAPTSAVAAGSTSAVAPAPMSAVAPAPKRPQVVLFTDTFTDNFSPVVGIAAIRVLEAAGFEVRLPQRSLCCGLTWVTTGQLDKGRRILARTVDALAADVTAGVPVVGLEPSCTAVLRGDALELLGSRTKKGTDVAAVSAGVLTLAELLTRHAPEFVAGLAGSLDGVSGVAQPHCHHRAVLGWQTDEALLTTMGAAVTSVGGCCGLAGNFGVEQGHYDLSVAVARTALLPAVEAADARAQAAGLAEPLVLADGFSCRTQLDDLAGRSSRHLAEVLADLLPEPESLPELVPDPEPPPESEPEPKPFLQAQGSGEVAPDAVPAVAEAASTGPASTEAVSTDVADDDPTGEIPSSSSST